MISREKTYKTIIIFLNCSIAFFLFISLLFVFLEIISLDFDIYGTAQYLNIPIILLLLKYLLKERFDSKNLTYRKFFIILFYFFVSQSLIFDFPFGVLIGLLVVIVVFVAAKKQNMLI